MDERENTSAGSPGEAGEGRIKASKFENVKQTVADKLHDAAGGLRNRVGSSESQSGLGRYGHQASDILDRSADYVRRFDYERANAQVRNYVREKPGRSLLMAGAAGLIIGALVRRR
jgi:ElaB/YqjD/DUF883 family membrane-anchored ribosome-binding protein